jgi:hypothetical protein
MWGQLPVTFGTSEASFGGRLASRESSNFGIALPASVRLLLVGPLGSHYRISGNPWKRRQIALTQGSIYAIFRPG